MFFKPIIALDSKGMRYENLDWNASIRVSFQVPQKSLSSFVKTMEIKKAIIKIFNISNELGDKFIQVLKGIEARKIPDWYEKQLKLVTEHQMLYEDGFIMNYDFFYDDIMNKKWKFENSVMSNSTLYLNFSLSGGTNFSAIFCIARMMDINFNNIQVEDPYFDVYSLSDDWI